MSSTDMTDITSKILGVENGERYKFETEGGEEVEGNVSKFTKTDIAISFELHDSTGKRYKISMLKLLNEWNDPMLRTESVVHRDNDYIQNKSVEWANVGTITSIKDV